MNIDLEEQLAAGMREHVADVAVDDAVLSRATRRHRRRTAVIRTGYALGVAGLAGVLAVGLTAGAGGGAGDSGTGGDTGRTVQAEAPASLRLRKAAAASDNISYRMKLTTGHAAQPVASTCEGAFDPLTATGYVRCPQDDSVMVELLIDGVRYMGGEAPLTPLPSDKTPGGETYGRYGVYPGKHDRLSLISGTVLDAAAPDPAALFKALQQANATVTQNPDGTFHFDYATQVDQGSTTTTGDVTLNADGRIAKVSIAGTWQSTAKGRLDTGTFQATVELSDYGISVRVERPRDVVPAN